MDRDRIQRSARVFVLLAALLFLWGAGAQAKIQGVTGTTFNLEAKADYIVTMDGDSFLMWGYSLGGGRMQYPGPTLKVNQGDTITINLTNRLSVPTSIVFPGHKVTAGGGSAGALAQEAAPDGGTVTYTFRAEEPGTYLYRSGTRPDLQVEMGLVGALIVYPSMGTNHAYNRADSRFDREYLYVLTEMDPNIHRMVESGQIGMVDTSGYYATNWFFNGRNFPDVASEPFVPWLPTQPYNCLLMMHPGEKILVRFIGGGRDLHPIHLHGNNFLTIGIDGRPLAAADGKSLAFKDNTVRVVPGQTADLIWTWTGEKLGWDVYGHAPGDPMIPGEYEPDHGKPFPVILATRDDLAFGAFYSGSPFLGSAGELPAGHPAQNSFGGLFYMWHSHTEKELTSNDLWPGGYVSLMIVLHPSVPIDPTDPVGN